MASSNGMRLLYVIDSLAGGGAETSLAAMAGPLVAAGVELHVAPLLHRDGVGSLLVDNGATLHSALGARRAAAVGPLARLTRDVGADLVHTTLFEADIAGRPAARLAGRPVVSSIVNSGHAVAGADARRLRAVAARVLDMATARLVTRFHAVSESAARDGARFLRVRRDRVDVVHRGRDAASLGVRSPDRTAATRAGLGLPPEALLVVAAGRHVRDKGFDRLMRAWPAVVADIPAARLVIAGAEGGESGSLARLAAEAGLSGDVFLGHRSDVPDLLAAANAFVAPSRREGLPGSVLEAMALGAPVIASDIEPMREAVGDGGGIFVVGNAPGALANAIIAVLRRPDEAASRAERARQRFEAHFTLDRAAEGMLAFYERAVGGA